MGLGIHGHAAELPTLTAINDVVANDGQEPRHIAEHQRGKLLTRARPTPPATSAAPALAICSSRY